MRPRSPDRLRFVLGRIAGIGMGAILAATALPRLAGETRPAPHFVSGGKADQEEGKRALQEFRAAGIAGDYWMEFELQVMPRKGPERDLPGEILGTKDENGPITRLSLPGGQWLIRSGPAPRAWTASANGVSELNATQTLVPLAGTDLAIFDLQMPFLYWNDFVYEGVANIRGRPAFSIILYPPADIQALNPDLGAVRIALDSQFHAMVQAEVLNPKGETTKSITVLDLKKTGEQWVVKSIDVRNAVTRDKTRFEVKAVDLNLAPQPAAFSPDALKEPIPEAPADKRERL